MKVLKKTFFSRPPTHMSFGGAIMMIGIFAAVSARYFGSVETSFLANPLIATRHLVLEKHEYWRLFTSVAIHHDWAHLLGNALFFIPFAGFLQNYFGFLIFPVACFAAGALINLGVILNYPPDVGIIGASGVVYFMVAFWMVLYFLIERQRSYGQRFLRCFGLLLAELMPQTFDPQVSYLSHILGFCLGILGGIIFFMVKKRYLRSYEVWEDVIEEDVIGFDTI